MDIGEIIYWLQEEQDFNRVTYLKSEGENLYFIGFDDEDTMKYLEFEPRFDKVVVSTRQVLDMKWNILEVLLPGF